MNIYWSLFMILLLAKHSVALRIINNLKIMLNYSLDVSTSSLIAICTISCLYKLFVHTSCLYERESVTYQLAHLHLNRKSSDDTSALYTTLSWDALMKTKCSHEMLSWKQNVRMRCSHDMFSREQVVLTKCSNMRTFWSPNVDFVLMRVFVQNTHIKCLQMWECLD